MFNEITDTIRYAPQIKLSTTSSCDSVNNCFSLNKPFDDRDPRPKWSGRNTTSVVVLSNPDHSHHQWQIPCIPDQCSALRIMYDFEMYTRGA